MRVGRRDGVRDGVRDKDGDRARVCLHQIGAAFVRQSPVPIAIFVSLSWTRLKSEKGNSEDHTKLRRFVTDIDLHSVLHPPLGGCCHILIGHFVLAYKALMGTEDGGRRSRPGPFVLDSPHMMVLVRWLVRRPALGRLLGRKTAELDAGDGRNGGELIPASADTRYEGRCETHGQDCRGEELVRHRDGGDGARTAVKAGKERETEAPKVEVAGATGTKR